MRTESQFRARTCLPVSYYKNATDIAPVHHDVTERGDQCAVAPPLLTSRGRSLATIGYFSHREACRAYIDAALVTSQTAMKSRTEACNPEEVALSLFLPYGFPEVTYSQLVITVPQKHVIRAHFRAWFICL